MVVLFTLLTAVKHLILCIEVVFKERKLIGMLCISTMLCMLLAGKNHFLFRFNTLFWPNEEKGKHTYMLTHFNFWNETDFWILIEAYFFETWFWLLHFLQQIKQKLFQIWKYYKVKKKMFSRNFVTGWVLLFLKYIWVQIKYNLKLQKWHIFKLSNNLFDQQKIKKDIW